MNRYLLEIGVEELPAKQITRVVAQLKEAVKAELLQEKLPYESIQVWSTPRRIAIYLDGIADNLADEQVTVMGPNVSIAYKDGEPTQALQGFLNKNNASVDDIVVAKKGKNDVVSLNTTVVGVESRAVLSRLAPGWVTAAAFDKSMRWRDYNVQFARPIRWILSIYNDGHLPVSIEGLDSDVYTFGHRTLFNERFKMDAACAYLDAMLGAKVIVEPCKRRDIILSQIAELEKTHNVAALKDDMLLDEVINIVEYPTVFSARFDEEFLALPIPTIVMPMKDHQRYFPTFVSDGGLSVVFFGVRNGDDYFLDTVAKGNEKVLRARLKDAQFFFAEDRKKKLEDFAEGLKTVLYQAQLGTVYDKVQRVKALSDYVAGLTKLHDGDLLLLHRAVDLCKADLNTAMVGEFAELQGVVGKIYAQFDGEKDVVSNAIESHYLPRFSDDDIPADMFGKIISLADKMDSLVGSFGIGVTPKGGKDPFGLRRMMISILSIVLAQDGFNPDLELVIARGADILADKFSEDKAGVIDGVKEALHQRLRILMGDKGFRFDAIEATLSNSLCDVSAFLAKCEALHVYDRGKLENIATNLLRSIKLSATLDMGQPIRSELFESDAEAQMYAVATDSLRKITGLVDDGKYTFALDELDVLGNAIAVFLEDVMVMHDDPVVSNNRKHIMYVCASAARLVADFEKFQFS